MSCNAHLRISSGYLIAVLWNKKLKKNIWIFFFLLSFFFFLADEMLSIFTCMFISVLALVFLLSQRTQINGEKSHTDLKNRCLKRPFLKLPIGEFALLEVGQVTWKTIL